MKHFSSLTVVVVTSLFVGSILCSGQEQRVTAKVKKQNAEHNAALDSGGAASTKTAPGKAPVTAGKKDPIPDLPTAEKALKFQLNVIKQAKGRAEMAAKNRATLHATYKGKNLDEATFAAVMKRYEAADKEVTTSEQAVTTALGAFDILLGKYQGYGGTTDYRAQLP